MLVADIKADTGSVSGWAPSLPFALDSFHDPLLIFPLAHSSEKLPAIPSASSVGKFHMNFLWFTDASDGERRIVEKRERERENVPCLGVSSEGNFGGELRVGGTRIRKEQDNFKLR